MDAYWNYIATPLFIFVVLFGIFVLFRISKTQVVSAAPIEGIIKALRAPRVAAAAAAAPAPAAADAAAK